MLLDKLRAERFEFSKFCVQSGLIVHTAARLVNRYYDPAMTEVNVGAKQPTDASGKLSFNSLWIVLIV